MQAERENFEALQNKTGLCAGASGSLVFPFRVPLASNSLSATELTNSYTPRFPNLPNLNSESVPSADSILAPVGDDQEVWVAGVTYFRSREARIEESQSAGVANSTTTFITLKGLNFSSRLPPSSRWSKRQGSHPSGCKVVPFQNPNSPCSSALAEKSSAIPLVMR